MILCLISSRRCDSQINSDDLAVQQKVQLLQKQRFICNLIRISITRQSKGVKGEIRCDTLKLHEGEL